MLGNEQQPIKLQNSQILNDLGTKLSHLPLVQRRVLAEVITQYREVSPDVPSKTNLIEHDVDVRDSVPIKEHPYRVSPMKRESRVHTPPPKQKAISRFFQALKKFPGLSR